MHKALLQYFFLKTKRQIGGAPFTSRFYLPNKPKKDMHIKLDEKYSIIKRDGLLKFKWGDEDQQPEQPPESQNFPITFSKLSFDGINSIKFNDMGFLEVTSDNQIDPAILDDRKDQLMEYFNVKEYAPEEIASKYNYKVIFLVIDRLPFPTQEIKEKLSRQFGIDTIDINIRNLDQKVIISFFTKLTSFQEINEKLSQIEFRLDPSRIFIDASDGGSLTEVKENLRLLTEKIAQLPIEAVVNFVKSTKQVITDLEGIDPNAIENISKVENLFQNFSTTLEKTAESYVIRSNKNPVLAVPDPEISDRTSSLLTIFKDIVQSVQTSLEGIDQDNQSVIITSLREKESEIDRQIDTIDSVIQKLNSATNTIKSSQSTTNYLEEQAGKQKSICRACKHDFVIQSGNQDLVFYNGTEQEVLSDSYEPMISLPNLVEKQDKDVSNEEITQLIDNGLSIDTDLTQLNPQEAGNLYKINYNGGNLEDVSRKTEEVRIVSGELKLKITDFKRKIIEYQKSLNTYKLSYVQSFYYSLFMLMSIKNSILTQSQLIYELLSVGNCQYYLNIIKVILRKINNRDIGPSERFFQKYHFLLLKDMELLLEFIIKQGRAGKGNVEVGVYNGIQANIIVSKCRGKMASLLSIFNSFKDILDAYKTQVLPPVSVYVRVNDWKQNNTFRVEDGKQKGVQHGSNNLPIDQRAEGDIIFTRNDADGRFLDVSLDKCSKLHYDQEEKLTIDKEDSSNYDRDYDEVEKKIRVEEVLTSTEIPTNEALNKYMSLSSQLTKKDIMLITYGTSGTGKSFALFGGRGQKGLLQSTLSEIRGRPKISFRVYELYCMGVQYPFYWQSREKIYQRCFTYRFNTSGDLEVAGVDMIDNYQGIKAHIQKTKNPNADESGFVEIEFRHYHNFVDIVEKIDKVRSKSKEEITITQPKDWPQRIKKTTNNPQSSRSIIIYEFLIQFSKDNNKRLVIVDLPGLEDPKISYVENPQFKIDDDVVEGAKILGASFLMNPIFIPLFKQEYTRAIKEFLSKMPKEIIDGWLDTDMITLGNRGQKKVITKEKVAKYITSGTRGLELTPEAGIKFRGDAFYKGPGLGNKNNETGDLQRFNNCFVYFILYIIKIGRIDILVDLITFIIQKKIIVEGTEDTVPIVPGSIGNLNNSTDDNQINYTSLKEKIKLAYEGIAINENILGLIYFLISKVEKTSDKDKLFKNPSYGIKSQADISKGPTPQTDEKDRRVSFDGKSLTDEAEMKKYIDEKTRILEETAGEIFAREARSIIKLAYSGTEDPNLITFDLRKDGVTTTKSLYKDSVDSYDHQKIFTVPNNLGDKEWLPSSEVQKRVANKQIPLIFDYLSPYLGAGPTSPQEWASKLDPQSGNPYYYNATTGITQWEKPEGFEEESKGIESVILFTLLTNNDPKKKCFYQIELLKDSLSFLKELVVQ